MAFTFPSSRAGWQRRYQDKVLTCWRNEITHKVVYKLKRVPKNFPMTIKWRRFYKANGTIPTIKMLQRMKQLTLTEAHDLFRAWVGKPVFDA